MPLNVTYFSVVYRLRYTAGRSLAGGGVKQGWVGKQAIFELKHQYHENGRRYVQSCILMIGSPKLHNALSIDTKIDNFG